MAVYTQKRKLQRLKVFLCCCLLLPWLQVSWESLEFRRKDSKEYVPERRRSMGAHKGGHMLGSLFGFLTSIYFFGFGKEQPFLQTIQSLSCAGALPLSNLFPGFSGACALHQLEAFPRFSQASAILLGWFPFRLLCTCLIVMLLIPLPHFLPLPRH